MRRPLLRYCFAGGFPNPQDPARLVDWFEQHLDRAYASSSTRHVLLPNGCDHTALDPFVLPGIATLQDWYGAHRCGGALAPGSGGAWYQALTCRQGLGADVQGWPGGRMVCTKSPPLPTPVPPLYPPSSPYQIRPYPPHLPSPPTGGEPVPPSRVRCAREENLSLRPVLWCTGEGNQSLCPVLRCAGEENLSLRPVQWCTGEGNLSLRPTLPSTLCWRAQGWRPKPSSQYKHAHG